MSYPGVGDPMVDCHASVEESHTRDGATSLLGVVGPDTERGHIVHTRNTTEVFTLLSSALEQGSE